MKKYPVNCGKSLKIGLVFFTILFSIPVKALQGKKPVVKIENAPSLIPLPQTVKWSPGTFSLNLCREISISDPSLEKEARFFLEQINKSIPIKKGNNKEKKYEIQLSLGKVKTSYGQNEAYHLVVKDKNIKLIANISQGIFNGLQTLLQLIKGDKIRSCDIIDYQAYQWRGYMIDVGRNFQSVDLLKQQIEVMARYKMNIFHFHLTEDIAWRLQIKQYPQLTSPESMLRDKGKFYSVEEMKDLIAFCADRHITLVPEIDMPGHSKAFTRAMGVDMQSDSGLEIVKNILHEVCTTYNLPYLHIGADEVKIRNKNFLPEVSQIINQYNIQTIGWSPGGDYDDRMIRHLWGSDAVLDSTVKHIDSRALYLADMDPESSAVTIFQRQFGGKIRGDSNLLGAEICVWGDRKIAKETDYITLNAVYPDMAAFGERSWRGGGYSGLNLDIGPDTAQRAIDFVEFEERLLAHKDQYFQQLPFPYVKQTDIKWKLFGPFENNGELTKSFWPENLSTAPEDSIANITSTGATLWLWYHNGEPCHAWLSAPRQNTTWYAFTEFWADKDTTISMWIGFENILRSLANATPPAGEWDYKKSMLWINREIIMPPKWKNAGFSLKSALEVPLVDEGYYYRPPTSVKVKKGWNKILVKMPLVMDEKVDPWQQRCMFSVMPVQPGEGMNMERYETEFRVNQ